MWRTLEGRHLFNGFAVAKVFRARCLDALRRAGLTWPTTLPKKWVVHSKHVGQGLPALKCLSRYLYRGVVSERDILRYDRANQTVTFRYRHAPTERFRHRVAAADAPIESVPLPCVRQAHAAHAPARRATTFRMNGGMAA